jgi:hypothetical protein
MNDNLETIDRGALVTATGGTALPRDTIDIGGHQVSDKILTPTVLDSTPKLPPSAGDWR